MDFKAVKGTRDFYPDLMRRTNWITDIWRRVSLRNGFEEYEAPTLEYLELFTAKSGPEIAQQLFNLTDRGGRNLAIRAEITPSLARMVNAKVSSLPRPIKWFSIPRLLRAENPQRGRLREFLQWNVDVIGEDSELADAECVFVAVDAMREMGLSAADVAVRYSSRAVLSALLAALGVGAADGPRVLAVLDKRAKAPPEAFEPMLAGVVGDAGARAALTRFLDAPLEGSSAAEWAQQAAKLAGQSPSPAMDAAVASLASFQAGLRDFGVADWCRYDSGIVRGLAYYTGVVYEVFDRAASLRAVAGGGRYDNLLEVLGGPRVSATGFGMGDVVLGILLEEKGRLPAPAGTLDYFVIDAEGTALEQVVGLTARLRGAGASADFSYKRQTTGKQLKEASRRGARRAVIVRPDGLAVKDLSTGEQVDVTIEQLLEQV
jgi:histidyl-tRNA synthetase